MRRWAVLSVLVFAFLGGGCTKVMWEHATRTHNPGYISDNVTIRDGVQRPVVSYRFADHVVALPIDCDGRISGPVVYTGDGRTAATISADLTDVQRTELRDYRFTRADWVRYTDLKWFPDDSSRRGSVFIELPDASCFAVAVDSDGRALPVRRSGKACTQDRLAEDARIVLVPSHQPQDPKERSGNITLAIVYTPITVATDIVFSPVYLLVYLAQRSGSNSPSS